MKKQEIYNTFIKANFKVCFQHDVAYANFKDLTRRTASDKKLQDEEFNTAKIQDMMYLKVVLLYWPINFLIKRLLLCMNGHRP